MYDCPNFFPSTSTVLGHLQTSEWSLSFCKEEYLFLNNNAFSSQEAHLPPFFKKQNYQEALHFIYKTSKIKTMEQQLVFQMPKIKQEKKRNLQKVGEVLLSDSSLGMHCCIGKSQRI